MLMVQLTQTGTGELLLKGNASVKVQGTDDSNLIIANQGAAVTLYHNNAGKLETTSGGVTVTGEVSMTTLDIGGTDVTATAAELNFSDGVTSNIQTQLNTKTSTGKAIAMAIVFG